MGKCHSPGCRHRSRRTFLASKNLTLLVLFSARESRSRSVGLYEQVPHSPSAGSDCNTLVTHAPLSLWHCDGLWRRERRPVPPCIDGRLHPGTTCRPARDVRHSSGTTDWRRLRSRWPLEARTPPCPLLHRRTPSPRHNLPSCARCSAVVRNHGLAPPPQSTSDQLHPGKDHQASGELQLARLRDKTPQEPRLVSPADTSFIANRHGPAARGSARAARAGR